jgi:peptidoglycan hydrolase-like protein with peptidoglycan-binding domain
MTRSYQQPGLRMSRQSPGAPALVRALQRDLRSLGYLARGIDGDFGPATEGAVRALRYDLLNNRGASTNGDGAAPVAVADFNRPALAGGGQAVTQVNGELDQDLAACIDGMLGAVDFAQVPSSPDPAAQNAAALQALRTLAGMPAPTPFIAAMAVQESDARHFRVPTSRDEDNFIVVGLDRHEASPDRIASRGYGIGQYTLFHHPPSTQEVRELMLDPVANVRKAFAELREKFDRFVIGPDDTADDRTAEHRLLPLRPCRYPPADARYQRACQACAAAAPRLEIRRGTPAYPGASFGYQPDRNYPSANYSGVPDRAAFLCDWPYAARRYNGSCNDSFHYQTRILLNLLMPDGGN